MLIFINLLFFIVSMLFYYSAPVDYDFNFCLAINTAFIVQNIFYFFLTKRSLISFEFFFLFSFYLVNFVYPVFYFPTNPTFSNFSFAFNHRVICRSTAIAFVAYSSYMFGLSLKKFKEVKKIDFIGLILTKAFFRNLLFLFVILAVAFIGIIGMSFFDGNQWLLDMSEKGEGIAISTYVTYAACLYAMFMFFIIAPKKRFFYSSIMVVFILAYLMSGSRTLPVGLTTILIVSYNDKIKKIPTSLFVGLVGAGVFLLSLIATVRSGNIIDGIFESKSNLITESESIFDFGADLIVCNRNLYVLVDYVDANGLSYGINMISGVLGIIPGLVNFSVAQLGIPVDLITTAGFATVLEFGINSNWGLGGNMVAEVYLAFGFYAVIILFFLFGIFLSKVICNYKSNVYYYIAYLFLVSTSIYMNREGFFMPFRGIIFCIVIFQIIKFVSANKRYSKKNSITSDN